MEVWVEQWKFFALWWSLKLFFKKIIIFVFCCFVFLTFLRYTSKMKAMLDRYHKLMEMMNEAETKILDHYVQELWRILKSGHKRFTWKSVGNGDTILKWP